MRPDPSPLDTVVFQSPSVAIGAFRCPPWHPLFRDSGPVQNYIFVFPRRAVRLCHEGRRPFVADPGMVTYYNRGQRYTRAALGAPDECEWFAVEPGILVDAVRQFDASVDDRPHQPFTHEHGPGDARAYLRQRKLFASLLREQEDGRASPRSVPDPLRIEETVIGLLDVVLRRAYTFWAGRQAWRAPTRRQRHVVEDAKALLAQRLSDPLGLAFFARETGVSPFHMCRAFRAVTGSTLHAYRNRLRLQHSLERVGAGESLLELALDLGYSSHSHFTAAFRRLFGTTPSRVRDTLA